MKVQWVPLLVSSLFFSTFAFTQEWVFPFPVYLEKNFLGEVTAYSNGNSVSAITIQSLLPIVTEFINDETLDKLKNYPTKKISLDELNKLGIYVTFQSNDLSLQLAVNNNIAREYNLSLGSKYTPADYSPSATWTSHNVFNLSSDYYHSEISDEVQTWLGEWLTTGNIGGERGVNFRAAAFLSGGNFSETTTYRGEVQVFIDNPSSPWRLTIGDITPQSIGHLPSVTLGGIAYERLYEELQPTRNIQNGGVQPLILNESAELELFINDVFISEFRLPPGRYNLDDLPLSSGNNDIRIEIRYQSGETDTIVYSQFFNVRLLRSGLSDFGVYAGLSSSFEENKYLYDEEQSIASAFYEYGFSDTITLGANGIYHPEGYLLGSTFTFGSDWGNIGLRTSAQNNLNQNSTGAIASLDYSHQIWGSDSYGLPNFRLSAEYLNQYTALPWSLEESATGYRVFSNYIVTILPSIDFSLSGDYSDFDEQDIMWFISSELTWDQNNWRITTGVEHEEDININLRDTRFTLSINWDWTAEENDYRASASYSNQTDRTRLRFQKASDNTVNSYGYRLTAESEPGSQNYAGLANYVGNRFTTEAEYSYTEINGEPNEQSAALRMSTALSVADGHIGWGRPYNGPVAIIDVHDSLEADVLINSIANDDPELISTSSISNLAPLSTGHVTTEIYVDAPNAPIGYNIGELRQEITPGSLTGHIIKIGSEASKTVIGSLINNKNPIAFVQGYIFGKKTKYEFFTNKNGRFVIEGIASGEYDIFLWEDNKPSGQLIIPEGESNLIYLPNTVLEGESHVE